MADCPHTIGVEFGTRWVYLQVDCWAEFCRLSFVVLALCPTPALPASPNHRGLEKPVHDHILWLQNSRRKVWSRIRFPFQNYRSCRSENQVTNLGHCRSGKIPSGDEKLLPRCSRCSYGVRHNTEVHLQPSKFMAYWCQKPHKSEHSK